MACDLFLTLRDLGLSTLAFAPFGRGEGGEVPGVEGDRLIVDIEDVGADVVQELVVVVDYDRTTGVVEEKLLLNIMIILVQISKISLLSSELPRPE